MRTSSSQAYVRRRFSGAAVSYGAAAGLQASLAQELVSGLDLRRRRRVLDIGAGDGALSRLLTAPQRRVIALDAARGMVLEGRRRCPAAAWVQADAGALPFTSGRFDLVVSASAYQWVDDLQRAFAEVRRVLAPGGRFAAVLFARATLEEFFVSLEAAACAKGRSLPPLRRLPSQDAVAAAVTGAGFRDMSLRVELRQTVFTDVKAVLAWLKAVGGNAAAPRFYWGKTLLAALEQEYRTRFSVGEDLRAGFEVLWIEAVV